MHPTQTSAAPTAATSCTPPSHTGGASALAAPASLVVGECSVLPKPDHIASKFFTRACGLWRAPYRNARSPFCWRYLSMSLALAYSEP